MEEVLDVCGEGLFRKSLYLPPNFAMNLKLLLKIVLKKDNDFF